MALPLALRKWAAFGTGVGIEIAQNNLIVTVVRVRPSGSTVLGSAILLDFRTRPAAEWGAEYAAFVKTFNAAHVASAVLVPRHEVIVRTLALPGVKEEELSSAVNFQLDALHPYAEDDAVAAWARLDAANVLVGVMRRQAFEAYRSLFSEAGIKVASFTFSAASIYSAIRLTADPPLNFLAAQETPEGWEIYGESAARPVFSAVFDLPSERALSLASGELRLPSETAPVQLGVGMSHAAAMTSACPALSLPANLLPESERRTSSRLRYVPTVVLAAILAALSTGIALHKPYDTHQYVQALEAELQRQEPIASRAPKLEQSIADTRGRVRQLDDFRRRTREDMDLILELTNLLPPPAFLGALDITRDAVTVAGEADQAAPLLRVLDNSKRLANSEFTTPIARVSTGEAFRIRSQREAPAPELPAKKDAK